MELGKGTGHLSTGYTHWLAMAQHGWARADDLRKTLKACRKNAAHRALVFAVYRCGESAEVDQFGYIACDREEVEPTFDGWYNVHGYRISTDPDANVADLARLA